MKRPIKKQLTLIFTGILAMIILAMILSNVLLLKNVFIMSRARNMEKAFDQIRLASENRSLESQDFLLSLRSICEKYNINVLIIAGDEKTVVSHQGNSMVIKDLENKSIDELRGEVLRELKSEEDFKSEITLDPASDAKYIEMWGILGGGEKIILRSPIENIENSVRISNLFIGSCGLLCILVGIVAIRLASNRIPKSLMRLAEISRQMAEMNFDVKYEGNSGDEVDTLGQNMNNLSEKLEETIAELKEANTALKKDIEKKEEVEGYQRDFIANASHELKTPIALIQGYAEGLKESVIEDPESRAFYCDVIIDEAGKMNELVRQLMSLNELEMGTKSIQLEHFNISELITNQIQTMSLPASNKGVTISYEPVDAFIWSDEFKVEEVFRNYLANAINHASGEKKVIVRSIRKEDHLRIEVFNSGEAIPEEALPKIWDKFYKVDRARTREYGGSGVGLSIVKATMELLGQEYGCENTEGGVLFYFTLPMQ